MILFTVGYQMAFDRMLTIVDEWSGENADVEVFGQIGPSKWVPRHMESVDFLPPPEYEKLLKRASLIVSHVGTGTIVTALVEQKPLIVFPRRGELGETRNDHQVTYCERLREIPAIRVATTRDELRAALDARDELLASEAISRAASPELIERLQRFAHEDPTGPRPRGRNRT